MSSVLICPYNASVLSPVRRDTALSAPLACLREHGLWSGSPWVRRFLVRSVVNSPFVPPWLGLREIALTSSGFLRVGYSVVKDRGAKSTPKFRPCDQPGSPQNRRAAFQNPPNISCGSFFNISMCRQQINSNVTNTLIVLRAGCTVKEKFRREGLLRFR